MSLKAEQSLDLGPHGEAEDDEDEDEERERECEAQPCKLRGAAALAPKSALRPVEAIGPADRFAGVHRRRLGCRWLVSPGLCFRLCHLAEV
jgi:hypothetical protein